MRKRGIWRSQRPRRLQQQENVQAHCEYVAVGERNGNGSTRFRFLETYSFRLLTADRHRLEEKTEMVFSPKLVNSKSNIYMEQTVVFKSSFCSL